MAGNAEKRTKFVQHVEPEVRAVDYRKIFNFELVTDLAVIRQHLDKVDTFSFDTETTGLNPLTSRLAGFSYSFDGINGFYVPIAHQRGVNAPRVLLEYIAWKIKHAKMVLMYNKKFDLNIMEISEGFDIGSCLNIFDVQALIWLRDTDYKMPSLKWASKHFLGVLQPTFMDTVGDATFDYAKPEDVLEYAGLDAVTLIQLTQNTFQKHRNLGNIIKIDNLAIEALRCIENHDCKLSGEWLKAEEAKLLSELQFKKKEIFELLGYQINPDSNKDKTDALLSMGVQLNIRTDKGAFKVDQEVLSKLDHPLAKLLADYSTTQKYYGTYIKALLKESEEGNKGVRFNYQHHNVPCLTEKSLLETNRGLISIKDVKEGDLVLTRFGFKPVTRFYDVGVADTLKVTTQSGREFEATPHHPFLVNIGTKKEFVRLDSLSLGDSVLCKDVYFNSPIKQNLRISLKEIGISNKKSRARKEIKFPVKLNKDLAYLIGFIAGDGSISEDGVKLCFNANENEIIDPICKILEKSFNVKRPKPYIGDDLTIQFKYCSVKLRDWFKGIQAKEDAVPMLIKNSKPDIRAGFLAGFFQADGCITKTHKSYWEINCKNTKQGLLQEIQILLSGLGITSRYKLNKDQDTHTDRGTVRIRGRNSVKNFTRFKMIGNKGTLLKQAGEETEFDYEEKFNDLYEDKIVDIQKSISHVYDISVGDTEEFIQNGIVVHNTGRLSSGGSDKNDYYAKFNIQSVKKPKEIYRFVFEDPTALTGWRFQREGEELPEKYYKVETGSPERGVRRAFVPDDPESTWVSIDYSTEELRIAAILSGETVWLDVFKNGGDLHTATAKRIFGENADGNDRKKAKIANFSIIYGSSAYSFAQKFKMSLEEAQRFVDNYFIALPRLSRWLKFVQKKAYKEDMYTYLGRPRRMSRYFFKEADRKMKSFGRRTASNTVVQGLGGDIIRLVLGRLHLLRLKNLEARNNFSIVNTVHDEINFSVKKLWIHKFMETVPPIMTIQFPEWPIALTVDVEVGDNWGETIKYKYDSETKKFTPNGELICEPKITA